MAPIRVLVVDDSTVIRKVLCEALAHDPSIQVVATAADGRIGLSKVAQLTPDLVTLDVEMPGMTGLEMLAEVRKLYPKLPVIMFSTLTERGAATTLDALSLGASDYATKPSNTGSLEVTKAKIQEELIPKIKALCARPTLPARPAEPIRKAAMKPAVPRFSQRIDLVAIGTSTGGPNALAELLPNIPRDFPVPIVIVQHMPPLFTRLLAERLAKSSSIAIQEGSGGVMAPAGTAWIAPGDHHMVVAREDKTVRLRLNQDAPENSCRPAVDPLFRSVAKAFGANALGVVLTGMGSDGVRGAQAIREGGAQVIVQDEASSVVWGMPGQVVAAGQADAIFPLKQMAQEIVRRVKNSRDRHDVAQETSHAARTPAGPSFEATSQPVTGTKE